MWKGYLNIWNKAVSTNIWRFSSKHIFVSENWKNGFTETENTFFEMVELGIENIILILKMLTYLSDKMFPKKVEVKKMGFRGSDRHTYY